MGTTVLMGGNEFRPSCRRMDEALLQRTGKTWPMVVILPTAAAHENPRLAASNGVRYFQSLGAQATAAMVVTRADAAAAGIIEPIRHADIVYLTGGSPSYLLDTLRDSAAWAAILERWQAGAMVVGSSAGAMVMGEAMHGAAALLLPRWAWRAASSFCPTIGRAPLPPRPPGSARASSLWASRRPRPVTATTIAAGRSSAREPLRCTRRRCAPIGAGNRSAWTEALFCPLAHRPAPPAEPRWPPTSPEGMRAQPLQRRDGLTNPAAPHYSGKDAAGPLAAALKARSHCGLVVRLDRHDPSCGSPHYRPQ